MKKIRLIIDGEVLVADHFSGVGNYTLEMMRAIDKELDHDKRFRASIFVYFRQIEKMRSYGFKNIKIIPSPLSLRISNALKHRNAQQPLDLLFGRGVYLFPNFSSWPLLRSKSIPFIYDISFEKYPQYAEPRNQKFLSKQVKLSSQRANHIVTISKSAQHEIAGFYKKSINCIGVYYPAVDLSHYYKRPKEEIADVREKYHIPESYILFVGNIEPRKNLKGLLLAYEKLSPRLQEKYSLVLVGAKGWQDGEIFEIINRLIKKGLSIVFPDRYVESKDLPAVYSGATVFVYPSIYEGFGIPPVEAMACGTAVVCADNSSLPEAVGNAAVMVDASSAQSVANGMSSLLVSDQLRQDMIKKGHKQTEKFSWNSSAKKLLQEIEKIS